jgi:mono/diheme cytochrome c family protein
MLAKSCVFSALLAAGCFTGGAASAADFFNGEKVYGRYCESCHGARGQGVIGGAPNFSRGQGLMKPDALLYDSILKGKNAMPAFRGVLTEEEFYDVITYIRSFL